jgi:DNA-binding IscR family transcriptional regulator
VSRSSLLPAALSAGLLPKDIVCPPRQLAQSYCRQARWSRLSQEHGISHITAEKALTKLRDEGVIHSVIGKGYYASGTSPARTSPGHAYRDERFTSSCLFTARNTTSTSLGLRETLDTTIRARNRISSRAP